MSVIESLLNLPLRHVSDNVCRFCQKTFCCTKCRDRHVDKVHPDLNVNCSLCASKTLPMRQFEFEKLLGENKKLLSHIADKHLPLRCILCENLIETGENLRSIGACKWYSEHRQILMNERLPRTPASFELKLKCNLSDNSHAFFTPPETYRNTSTPMFISQKNSLEYQTPCAPNFNLKTPKTNSPSIAQNNATSKIQQSQNGDSDIKFFSFSPNTMENEGMTPFRSNADDQFPRSNSGRKLDIKEPNETVHGKAEEVASNGDYITHPVHMDLTTSFKSNTDEQFPTSNSGRKLDIKESSETVYNEAEKVASYDDYITSPIDMDLTNVEDNIPQKHTPKLNVGSREESGRGSDIVKKVRFSDQYETLSEFGNQFYIKNTLNTTEEDDDVFHDAHDASDVKNTKSRKSTQNTENTKDVNGTNDSKNTKIMKDIKEKDTKEQDTEEKRNEMENIKDAKSDQVDNQELLVMSSKDSLDSTEINTFQENQQNAEKENRVVEALSNGVSVMAQKGTSKMLMMVLIENNLENLNTDLMPLINSGLKKLEEQIVSPSSGTSEFSNVVNSANYTRSSVTKVEMSVSSVESYSDNNNNAEMTKDYQQIVPDFPSSSAGNGQTSSNGGILSTVAQAVRLAFKNLSSVTSSSINSSQVVQQQQIVGDTMSLPETNVSCDLEVRYGKRSRDEVSSWMDPVPISLDIRSPLPKRKRGWYKIKGRRPIRSVLNGATQVTSPRRVSSETQFFNQRSLIVGDTVLSLPARAHSEVSHAPAE